MPVRTRPLPPARPRVAVALTAVVALLISLLATVASPGASAQVVTGDEDGRGQTGGRTEARAVAALGRVQSIVRDGAQGRDLTMALRDLATLRGSLRGGDRTAADRMLARPTDGDDPFLDYSVPSTRVCGPDVCVHYVESTDDAPADDDYVATAQSVLADVHDRYVRAGYREPKADRRRGGDNRLDVYLGDIGKFGVYGYCTSDDPSRSSRRSDRWAYCVLDNDYSTAEFPTNTPVENLKVTAAHEYFHAVQYAYDVAEDSWLLEATATWAEDELYDGIDDNVQYLRASQLMNPRIPLDTFNRNGFQYGTWSFVRFLTERFDKRRGGMPRLVHDLFDKVDGAPGGPDLYSWQAIDAVLKRKRTSGATMLAAYAVANRRPDRRYAEGRRNNYPTAPLAGRTKVGAGRPVTFRGRLDHLTTATVQAVPKGLTGRRWRLRVTADLPSRDASPVVLISSTTRTGRVRTVRLRLDRLGEGTRAVPFGKGAVREVEVTLANGSGRFACGGGAFSCQGRPLDDNAPIRLTLDAVRR